MRYKGNSEEYQVSMRLFLEGMTDQQLSDRYSVEMLKLKAFRQFGRESDRFLGYAGTTMMNRCSAELKRRGLPLPEVHLPED